MQRTRGSVTSWSGKPRGPKSSSGNPTRRQFSQTLFTRSDVKSYEKRKNRDCITSLVVEVDEKNNTERVYWVKNEDLSLESSSQDLQTLNSSSLSKMGKKSPNRGEDSGQDENIFDVTTPMKKPPEVVSDDDAKSSAGFNVCGKNRNTNVTNNAHSNDENRGGKVPGKTLEALVKVSNVTDMSKGKLGGALFTDEKGYTYIHHSTSAFKRQLRCSNSNLKRNKCRARASIILNDANARIVLSSRCPPHNHPPVTKTSLASKFARLLKKRVCSCPRTPIVQLYDEECKRFPEGAKCLPRHIALQRMQRYRREFGVALYGKDKSACPPPDDDPSIPSTELKMLAEGRIIYVDHKGYQYHQQHATANKRQLRCTKARLRGCLCPARASMDLKPRYSHIKMTRNRHNHPPPDPGSALFSYNLRLRAREEPSTSLKQIYEEEAKRNPDVASIVTFPKMRQSMQRARRSADAEHSSLTSQTVHLTFDSVYDLAMEEAQDPLDGAHQMAAAEVKVGVGAERSAIADVTGGEPAPGPSCEVIKRPNAPDETSKPAKLSAVKVKPSPEPAADGPVPTVEVVVSTRQRGALDEMVLYQCPYCQKLFDEDEPLEQHILTSHINIIVPESNMWEEAQLPK